LIYKNVFYFHQINVIGGVETFFYEMAKKYGEAYDICIIYKEADPNQLLRLSKLVRCIKYTGQYFQCKKAFLNFTMDIIDHIEAEEYYQILHADYKAQHISPNSVRSDKLTGYLGVSQFVCDTFEEISGKKVKLMYNPFTPKEPKQVLHLISATRLTKEKGKNRMIQFANALDAAGRKYIWTVFTNDVNAINNPNIIYMKPRLDIIDYIADADYLVQLSDTEGYSYSIIEALSVGTPVIITDLPVCKEMGVVNGKNGYILPFDMSRIPVQEIYRGLPAFQYKPNEDKWGELLAPGKNTYFEDLKTMVLIEATAEYNDIQLQRLVERGEVIEVNKIRAEQLIEAGVGKRKG